MLIGAALTRYVGYEGTMMIREGSSSNQIISMTPYVQVTIQKDGTTFYHDKEHLFTAYKKNKFKDRFMVDGETVTLRLADYIPSAAETVVEDPDGSPIITLVSVDKGTRKSYFLKSGECKNIAGLNMCFNDESGDPLSIRINTTSEGGLEFVAPFPVALIDMMAGTDSTLSAQAPHSLQVMKLYNFSDIQVVVRSYLEKGKMKLVNAQDEEGGASAIVMDLTYKGETETVNIIGGANMLGKSTEIQLAGATFNLSYGSKMIDLPFSVMLRDFQLERYPGSMSPSSFASEVTVIDTEKNLEMPYRIFMNNILNYGGYRFFQSSYDKDEKGTILSVNHDQWGTVVTYIGYFLLAAGLVFNFFSKNSRFRRLSKASSQLKNKAATAMVILALLLPSIPSLAQHPGTVAQEPYYPSKIDPGHAREFGRLLVQDKDGRMKPINTLSSEILRKVYRKDKFEGLNSDQVLLGMVSNPEYWQNVPMIKVSDKQLKELLGITGKFASFNDFIDARMGSYKLSNAVNEAYNKKPAKRSSFDKDVMKVDERVNVVYMVYIGDYLNLFPEPGHPNHKWHTAAEADVAFDSTEAGFVQNILPVYYSEVLEAMNSGDWTAAGENLGYIKLFQEKYGSQIMPPVSKTKLEVLYNDINIFKRLFPVYALLGFILLITLFIQVLNADLKLGMLIKSLMALILIAFIFHTLGLAVRWYISGHAPWSNGYETMIYISWGTVLSGLLFSRTSRITLATTAILASVTLMVANLSWLDPEITPLVPVLKSYWLVIHVAVITASYSFLGVGALLGLLNLILITFQNRKNYNKLKDTIEELTNINEMNLIIGVFLITIGTFLGAVWANESWGRYWGWDPKETWALVTVLVYSFIIHMRLIPGLNGVYGFNFAALIGFSSVLMTYFGVNYYLSGLHSYAAGDPVPIPTFVYYAVAIVALISIASYLKHYKMNILNSQDKN
jgi:cytochrome c-type biogenesis protein CcsB